jgi:CheY-like chemotaxis protein
MNDSLSILIVDDNPAMAISLTDVLEFKGFQVHLANSGKNALVILQEHPVDIMLTDVIMPEMNGLELYRETRKTHPRLLTWFMTAYAADALISQGLKEGIKTVFNKPIDMELLLLFLNASRNMLK